MITKDLDNHYLLGNYLVYPGTFQKRNKKILQRYNSFKISQLLNFKKSYFSKEKH